MSSEQLLVKIFSRSPYLSTLSPLPHFLTYKAFAAMFHASHLREQFPAVAKSLRLLLLVEPTFLNRQLPLFPNGDNGESCQLSLNSSNFCKLRPTR